MSTYLVIKNGTMTKSYACKESASTPYLKVSNSYLPLTTETGTGLHVKASGSTFIPLESKATTLTTTITEYRRDYGESNSTSIVHSSSLYYFSASRGNCYIYYTSNYTWYEYSVQFYMSMTDYYLKTFAKPLAFVSNSYTFDQTREVMYSSDGWNNTFPTVVINKTIINTKFLIHMDTNGYAAAAIVVHANTSLNSDNAPLVLLNTKYSMSTTASASTRNYLSSSVTSNIAFALNNINPHNTIQHGISLLHDIMRINQANTSRAINRSLDVTTFSLSLTYMTNFSSVTDYGESKVSSDGSSITYVKTTSFSSNGEYKTTYRVAPIISSNRVLTQTKTMTKTYTTSTQI